MHGMGCLPAARHNSQATPAFTRSVGCGDPAQHLSREMAIATCNRGLCNTPAVCCEVLYSGKIPFEPILRALFRTKSGRAQAPPGTREVGDLNPLRFRVRSRLPGAGGRPSAWRQCASLRRLRARARQAWDGAIIFHFFPNLISTPRAWASRPSARAIAITVSPSVRNPPGVISWQLTRRMKLSVPSPPNARAQPAVGRV